MSAQRKDKSGFLNLFDDPCLSDVKVKFSGQQIHAHKVVLSGKCEYFFKAFTGGFPVANSDEIDLGDDDDAEAVRAVIRHLYTLPYDILVDDEADTGSGLTNDDLMFHINVFVVADKYDVPSLRSLVVNKFKDLMESSWEGSQFAPAMKAVCLPSAPKLADPSLQKAAAAFCATHIDKLVQQDAFKKILHEEEPFAGRLLVDALKGVPMKGCVCRRCEYFHKCTKARDIPAQCPSCGMSIEDSRYYDCSYLDKRVPVSVKAPWYFVVT